MYLKLYTHACIHYRLGLLYAYKSYMYKLYAVYVICLSIVLTEHFLYWRYKLSCLRSAFGQSIQFRKLFTWNSWQRSLLMTLVVYLTIFLISWCKDILKGNFLLLSTLLVVVVCLSSPFYLFSFILVLYLYPPVRVWYFCTYTFFFN